MPLYTYVCNDCNCEEEHLEKMEGREKHKHFCPECGVVMVRKIDPVFLGKGTPQMGAILDTGEVVPGHFGKTAKREKK